VLPRPALVPEADPAGLGDDPVLEAGTPVALGATPPGVEVLARAPDGVAESLLHPDKHPTHRTTSSPIPRAAP
jgi:hypothetical protein